MKKLFLFILVCVLFTGCFLQVEHPSQINVTWRIVGEGVQPANEIELGEEMIQVNQDVFYGFSSKTYRKSVVVEADVDGDTSREFEFELSSENQYKKLDNHRLSIEPETPEKGAITIRSGELEKNVLYEILPTSGFSHSPFHPYRYKGFDFATETIVEREKRDLWRDGLEPFHYYIGAGAVIDIYQELTAANFLDHFVATKDVREYEFEELKVFPDGGDTYAVKCESGGYAVIAFVSRGAFVYKYSETGVFD